MLTIQSLIQIYLDNAAPWILVWLGAVALDMLFGGPKALGLVPSLDSVTTQSVQFLQTRLERQTRSKRAHYWRGITAAIVLGITFGAAGYGLDQLVFLHPALTAVAVFFIAKFLSLKIAWQQNQKEIISPGADKYRRLARQPIELIVNYYIPAALLFVVGGFSLLLPFSCLHVASLSALENHEKSFFLKPFARLRSVAAFPGEIIGSAVMAIALLFWPAANWKQGWLSVFHFGKSIRLWPLTIAAHAFNWSIERLDGTPEKKWVGPTHGLAHLKPADVKNALIVALIAFAIANAVLALLWLAAFVG